MNKNNNYLNDDEKKKIIELHKSGFNTVQIAEKLNRHNSSIGRYLRKQGFENNGTNSKFNDEDKVNIKNLYESGMTSKNIYQLYKDKASCEETIQTIIRKMKISRNKGYQNKLKENYFEVIDTPLKAYFLGFLLTDGNVHNPKRKNRQSLIQIGLMLGDKYILEKFKNELDCDNKISEYNNGRRHECYFRMYSNKMANDLSKYGVVPNKTFLINNIPKVPQEYMPDLIRGIFDGDGTVYILKSNNKLRFGFYGTHNLVNSIVHYLNNLIDLPLNKIRDKETVSFLTFGADRDIRNFYKYIYYNEDVFCLKRKREKFEKYI